MKADLHIHSIYSDGDYDTNELALKAKAKDLKLVALTDHDTIDGVEKMIESSKKLGIECFTGIELSTFSNREIHILGYNVDIFDNKFREKLITIKEQRRQRIFAITEKLSNLDIDITVNEVFKYADKKASVGRVHISKALIAKNYVKTVEEAFNRYLGYNKAAYVPSFRMETKDAIELIKSAKGKAFIAHPLLINIERLHLPPLIKAFKNYGLDGIEADYSAHTKSETEYLKGLAKKLNLIPSCGSDFHGDSRQGEITAYELSDEDYIKLKE